MVYMCFRSHYHFHLKTSHLELKKEKHMIIYGYCPRHGHNIWYEREMTHLRYKSAHFSTVNKFRTSTNLLDYICNQITFGLCTHAEDEWILEFQLS